MEHCPPLYAVKHLTIGLFRSILNNPVEVIKSLLWLAPHPETISICTYKDSAIKNLKFTYEEQALSMKKKCGCCESLPVNCWRHPLVEVCIENIRGHRDDTELAHFFHKEMIDGKIEFSSRNISSDSK